MSERDSARAIAIGRAALGAGLLIVPGLAARAWVGGDAGRPATKVAMRAVGARDVALGAGALRAMSGGAPARGWIEAGVAADAADFAATLTAGRALPLAGRLAVLCLAGAGVAAGARIAGSLD